MTPHLLQRSMGAPTHGCDTRIRNNANVLACFAGVALTTVSRHLVVRRAKWGLRAGGDSLKTLKTAAALPVSVVSDEQWTIFRAGMKIALHHRVRAAHLKERRPRLDCGDRTSRTTGRDSPTDAIRCPITRNAFPTPDSDGG